MDSAGKLENLEKLLAELSIEVRFEKGDFVGGLYRYKERKALVVNKQLPDEQKVQLIAQELRNSVDLQNLYVMPALREVIENASRLGE